MTDTTTLIQRLRHFCGDMDLADTYGDAMVEAADALEQQAAQIEALRADAERMRGAMAAPVLHEVRATTPERLTMKVELTKDWCMNVAKIEDRPNDAAPICVWCETRVPGACKSRYDTLTCTHRVMVPTAEQWDSAVEARNGEPTHPAQWSAGYDAGFKDGHQAACEALQRDAERYRWLRLQDWDTCPLAVVANPKDAIKLGHDAPSLERLDAMIDTHVAEIQFYLNHALAEMAVADPRKPCTCDGAGRGPGRECVVKAGGRLGELWRCSEGCNGCDDCTDYES